MTRDVYAGDESAPVGQDAAFDDRIARVNIVADDAPEVLHRVAAAISVLNSSPEYFLLERTAEGTLNIEVHIRGSCEFAIDMLCRKLWQLTCVVSVAAQQI